jgi:hypothetical protein
MLANVEELPKGKFSADLDIHKKTQILLLENKISEAWKLLTN